AGPGETMDYTWYAGRLDFEQDARRPSVWRVKRFPEEFGTINLNSYGDIIKHGAQGLVGALIIEPEKAEVTVDPDTNTVATVRYPKDPSNPSLGWETFKEFVLVYQDGLNLLQAGADIASCHICDDVYDRGEAAFNYRTEPFATRLAAGGNMVPLPGEGGGLSDDTNASQYPADFFMSSYKNIETPVFRAKPTDRVRMRVLQPHGRSRQHTFLVYGHDYDDYGMHGFGTPHSSLISVGKGITAELLATHEGTWLYRSGANMHFARGMWGQLVVESQPTP
ncbi:MAG: copper oxidase, partial [Nitrospinales bacterium]